MGETLPAELFFSMSPYKVMEWTAVALGLAGQYLVGSKRMVPALWFWMASNILAIPVALNGGLEGMAILYLLYMGFTARSLWTWSQETKAQKSVAPSAVHGKLAC